MGGPALLAALVSLASVLSAASTPAAGPVRNLPGLDPSYPHHQYAGRVTVNSTCEASLFYWIIESQSDPANDPVVFWFNGGPGSSSLIGFFKENGPFRLAKQTNGSLQLNLNPYSWNRKATYIMVDQPADVGLSYVSSAACVAPVESQAMDQLAAGVRAIFGSHQQYSGLPVYLFSESYGGKYVPELAVRLLANPGRVNLHGIGVGDGWVSPLVQENTYSEYAYMHGLISLADKVHVDTLYKECKQAVVATLPVPSAESDQICGQVEGYISQSNVSGGVNVYDVRKFEGDPQPGYDFTLIGEYLDQPSVRTALHVDPRKGPWATGSELVGADLETGEQAAASDLYQDLLKGARIRVLIYNGIFDMDCNFVGTDAWLEAVTDAVGGEVYRKFSGLVRKPWKERGVAVGSSRSTGNLTQVLVNGAGHLVPMDQPENALALLETFIADEPFN